MLFFRTVVYVDLPDGKTGDRVVRRFMLSREAQETIRDFDLDKPVLPEQGVRLIAPSGAQTLESTYKWHKKYREKEGRRLRREALLKGTIEGGAQSSKLTRRHLNHWIWTFVWELAE